MAGGRREVLLVDANGDALGTASNPLHTVGGGGGSVAVADIQLPSEEQKYVVGMNEEVVAQRTADFDRLDASITDLQCALTAMTEQTGGASGTYRVRLGGTVGVADGTEVVRLDAAHASYAATPDFDIGSSFPRPTGQQLVKITARASIVGQKARILGYQIVFAAP